MGKKIDWSNAVAPDAQPVMEQTLEFMEVASRERSVAGMKMGMQPYVSNDVVILWGCVNTTPGTSTFTISAGAVFYNGEYYEVDAVTFTAAGTAVATLVVTQDPVDPIKMEPSGNSVSVHNITKVVIADAVSGSGIKDFNDFKIASRHTITGTATNGTSIQADVSASGPFVAAITNSYFRYEIDKGICHLDFKFILTMTDGAIIERLDVPLPKGLVKATSFGENYAMRGHAMARNPTATSNYMGMTVFSDFGGAEGQRLSLFRNEGTTSITWETASVATITGRCSFPLA